MGAAREFFLISWIPKRFEKLEFLGNLGNLGAMAFWICFAALR